MGSLKHPKLFDPRTMGSVRDVFHDVVRELEEQDALSIDSSEQRVKGEIIERLLDLVSEGAPETEWKAKVLAAMLSR